MKQNQNQYNLQLDGLRAVAVVLVIFYHWYPANQGINTLATGPLGVTLFFVLSGFLITRILIWNRQLMPAYGFSRVYGSFMIRRMLRIFPLYYAMLGFVWIAPSVPIVPEIETDFYKVPSVYLLYASNFLIDKTGNWADALSIYWTLAVEEQFYIIWPVLILTIPTRHLRKLTIISIVTGMLARGGLYLLDHNEGVLMPTCLDAFALGGLWAVIQFENENPRKFLRKLALLAPIGLVLFVFFSVNGENSIFKVLFFRLSMSVCCLYCVANATCEAGFGSFVGVLLNNKAVCYLGKISYGLYVYHIMIPYIGIPILLNLANRMFHASFALTHGSVVIISAFMLLFAAMLSRCIIETPFNRLKSSFELVNEAVSPAQRQ